MKKYFALIIALLFFSSFGLAAKSSDFVKISEQDINFFTHQDIVDADYFLGTDKIFYGSKEGSIIMKIYFAEKLALFARDFKIGLESKSGKNFIVNKVKIGESEFEINSPQPSNSFIFNQAIRVEGGILKTAEIFLTFDPDEIGLREEIDVILYSKNLQELLRNDPFISGFGFRQRLTLDTTQLSGDVDANHSIIVYLDPTNTDFWANETHGTGNGITFAQSDEITETDFDDINFNVTDQNAWFSVNMTETFTSATDLDQFLYYGGSDTDNSDGVAAYPSTYTSVWHMEEVSGTVSVDSTVNDFNLTHADTPTLNLLGQINVGTSYANAVPDPTSFQPTILDGGYSKLSICFWWKRNTNGALGNLIIKDNVGDAQGRVQFNAGASGALIYNILDDAGTEHLTTAAKTDWDTTQFFHICGTFDSADNNMFLYVDGSTTGGDALSEAMNAIGAGTQTDLIVGANVLDTLFLDEVKVFDGTELSADEVELMFLSESIQLITFGGEEIFNEPPDINILTPNATGTQIKGGDVFVIDFNVSDLDDNTLLIDLNFSSSSTQGTGTVIVNDENTTGGDISCDDADFSNSTNCTFSWTTPTSDANFFMLATATDGSTEIFDAGDNNFMIDSTAPTFLTILPDVNFTKTELNLDFNATIDDGVGSGNFRCITRVFFDDVLQASLDLNVDGSSGTCIRSLSSGIPDDTNVSVGFKTVDNVGNVSDENRSQNIFFSPPPIPPKSIDGTGQCEIDLEINFYLGQYLQITYSGFTDTGNIITGASFDVFKGNDIVINDQNLTAVGDFFTFVINRKANDDPYTVEIESGNCFTTRIVQV